MSSEVFVLSSVRHTDPVEAIRLAIARAEIEPKRVQDAYFGFERSFTAPGLQDTARKAGLSCPAVSVSSSMRAVFFGAQSILAGDEEIAVVAGVDGKGSCVLVLAGSEAIGRWNLTPRARLAERSMNGADSVLTRAEVKPEELEVRRQGEGGSRLIYEVLEELERRKARLGMVSIDELTLLLERL